MLQEVSVINNPRQFLLYAVLAVVFVALVSPNMTIAAICLAIAIWFNRNHRQQSKQQMEDWQDYLHQNGFIIDRELDFPGGKFYVDDGDRRFAVLKGKTMQIYPYADLGAYELNEDGNSIVSGKGMAAVVGFLVLGPIGALIGAVTGSKAQNTCTALIVRLMVNDLNDPQIVIRYISKETKKNSSAYSKAMENARSLIALLQYIEKNS